MSTLLDTLLIKIDGDARGIQSVIKSAVNTATGAVQTINKQEVDWTSIFTRSVTPAIIGGIASMFAYAIDQSLQFQQAMNETGTAAGQNSGQIAQMGQSALNLSTQVPESAQDIANAMAQVSAIFSGVADQQQVVAAMAELAASGFGSLNDITNASIGIFKQFGVTTSDQAIDVLTSLMHAAEGAKETIPALAEQFSGFSDQLPGTIKTLGTFNGLISTFASEVANLGANGATQIFQALAASSSSAAGPMEILGQSFGSIQKSLLTDGGLTAIMNASKTLDKMGPQAAMVATSFGLSAQQVSQFQTNAGKLDSVVQTQKQIATNEQTINAAYAQSNSQLRQLQLDWAKFKAIAVDAGTALLPVANLLANMFVTGLSDAKQFFSTVTDGFGSMLSVFYGNNLKDAIGGAFKSAGALVDQLANQIPQQIGNGLSGIFGGKDFNPINSALTGTGVGFSTGSLSRIDQTASESNMMDSLLSALQTGIKGGQYTSLVNTFHLNVPAGSAGLTAKQIASQLYAQFQGTNQ